MQKKDYRYLIYSKVGNGNRNNHKIVSINFIAFESRVGHLKNKKS